MPPSRSAARDTMAADQSDSYWIPRNFLALDPQQARLESSSAVLVPVPYDSSTSFRGGARDGPNAIIDASYGLEDYDLELDLDVSRLGIHTTSAVEPHMGGPEAMAQRVRRAVAGYIREDRVVGVLGGEHSVSAGAVMAHGDTYPDLSVLYIDAHADMRDSYMGTSWGHASGARRIREVCSVVLVGVRSLCLEERDFLRESSLPVFFWPPVEEGAELLGRITAELSDTVYVSIDLDALDPSCMAAVGTPEPGGMNWDQMIMLLKGVADSKRIVGFDVCELAPGEGPMACSYTAAKLVYKLVGYATARFTRGMA